MGASDASAAAGSSTAARDSYSTRIAATAATAASAVSAATAATRSPTNRTLSHASSGRSRSRWPVIIPRTSAPVMMARTPGMAAATLVSMATIRAWGRGLPRNAAWSIPGRAMSGT